MIRGRHEAAIVQYLKSRFVTDENLHTVGMQALIEQLQKIPFLVERLEQALEFFNAGQVRSTHQVGFSRHHILDRGWYGLVVKNLLGQRYGVDHQGIHVLARLLQLQQDFLPSL